MLNISTVLQSVLMGSNKLLTISEDTDKPNGAGSKAESDYPLNLPKVLLQLTETQSGVLELRSALRRLNVNAPEQIPEFLKSFMKMYRIADSDVSPGAIEFITNILDVVALNQVQMSDLALEKIIETEIKNSQSSLGYRTAYKGSEYFNYLSVYFSNFNSEFSDLYDEVGNLKLAEWPYLQKFDDLFYSSSSTIYTGDFYSAGSRIYNELGEIAAFLNSDRTAYRDIIESISTKSQSETALFFSTLLAKLKEENKSLVDLPKPLKVVYTLQLVHTDLKTELAKGERTPLSIGIKNLLLFLCYHEGTPEFISKEDFISKLAAAMFMANAIFFATRVLFFNYSSADPDFTLASAKIMSGKLKQLFNISDINLDSDSETSEGEDSAELLDSELDSFRINKRTKKEINLFCTDTLAVIKKLKTPATDGILAPLTGFITALQNKTEGDDSLEEAAAATFKTNVSGQQLMLDNALAYYLFNAVLTSCIDPVNEAALVQKGIISSITATANKQSNLTEVPIETSKDEDDPEVSSSDIVMTKAAFAEYEKSKDDINSNFGWFLNANTPASEKYGEFVNSLLTFSGMQNVFLSCFNQYLEKTDAEVKQINLRASSKVSKLMSYNLSKYIQERAVPTSIINESDEIEAVKEYIEFLNTELTGRSFPTKQELSSALDTYKLDVHNILRAQALSDRSVELWKILKQIESILRLSDKSSVAHATEIATKSGLVKYNIVTSDPSGSVIKNSLLLSTLAELIDESSVANSVKYTRRSRENQQINKTITAVATSEVKPVNSVSSAVELIVERMQRVILEAESHVSSLSGTTDKNGKSVSNLLTDANCIPKSTKNKGTIGMSIYIINPAQPEILAIPGALEELTIDRMERSKLRSGSLKFSYLYNNIQEALTQLGKVKEAINLFKLIDLENVNGITQLLTAFNKLLNDPQDTRLNKVVFGKTTTVAASVFYYNRVNWLNQLLRGIDQLAGLFQIQINTSVPVAEGVLRENTEEQAANTSMPLEVQGIELLLLTMLEQIHALKSLLSDLLEITLKIAVGIKDAPMSVKQYMSDFADVNRTTAQEFYDYLASVAIEAHEKNAPVSQEHWEHAEKLLTDTNKRLLDLDEIDDELLSNL